MTRSMLKSNNQMSNSDRSLSPLTNENSVQIGPATAITIDDSRELSLNNFNISTKNRTQSIDQHAIIDLNNESEVAKNAGARSVGNTSRYATRRYNKSGLNIISNWFKVPGYVLQCQVREITQILRIQMTRAKHLFLMYRHEV